MKVVNHTILILFLFLELCCAFCHFKELHQGHRLLEIFNEESVKKENITIEGKYEEIEKDIIKMKNIKEKIENEIIYINNSYDKIYKEVTEGFIRIHEKLIKRESELIQNLQNEVTKIKEKLEIFLSQTNQIIKNSELINKGIKSIEKENKNIIKTLTYVSKINKNKKDINKLKRQLIKNTKISFKEDETNIKFDDYYFNGIPSPKNIQFKDIIAFSFIIMWNIDNINLINIDKNKIKYKVEIKEKTENKLEEFKEIYEGENNNCIIDNLKRNSYYEIKICCFYNDIIGDWSEIKEVKTLNIDSLILSQSNRAEEFIKKIYEWTEYNDMELLYRGSRDGSTSKEFHDRCDNKGPTICLYKNDKDYIFGGYASISWTCKGGYYSARESFIFTLTNIHGTEPTKFPNTNKDKSVYHHSDYGPSFGDYNDIDIRSDYKKSVSYIRFPKDYKDTLNNGKSIFTGNLDNNKNEIYIKEIEVFKLYK